MKVIIRGLILTLLLNLLLYSIVFMNKSKINDKKRDINISTVNKIVNKNIKDSNNEVGTMEDEIDIIKIKEQQSKKITVSVAGDFTLGTDESYGYYNSFVNEVKKHNYHYDYFIEEIKPIFLYDDLSLVNLETTLTNATKKATKKFRFKGEPDFVNILNLAGIEAVNIANNHIYDYLQQGFQDTIHVLEKSNIGFFGYGHPYIMNIKGVRIGVLGYTGWDFSDSLRKQIEKDLNDMKQRTDLIIVSFHWGVENHLYPEATQINIAHYAIDEGADLVFGHHPHVIQGIERYHNKYIVYSLGNFLYGGHRNPSDKDTFIFQESFYFDKGNKQLTIDDIQIIPFSISSVSWRNNYKPIKLKGAEIKRFNERMKKLSSIFKNN